MTEVRYGVVRTSGWAGWVIRAATHSSVNHAFVVNGDGKIIEADPHGLQYNHLTSYPGAILSDPIGGQQADTIWNWSVAHLGVGYGFVDILALALLCLGVPTPQWALRRLTSTSTLICSQAVVSAYDAAGIHLGDKAAALTTPGDLLDVLHGSIEPSKW